MWKKAFALTLLTILPVAAFSNCPNPETWSGASSGNWNDVSNWSPSTCIPGSGAVTDTDSATFGPIVGVSSTISLDGIPITPGLSQLIFNQQATPFTINSATHFLQFNGAASSIEALAGSHVLNTPVHLNNTALSITVSGPGELLTLKGVFSEALGSTSSIIFQGPGNLLNENNQIAINGDFFALSGFLVQTNTSPVSGVGMVGSLISSGGNLTVNGNLSMTNTGAISNGADGSFLGAIDAVINSGTVELENTGTVTTTASGNFFSINNLTINGGSVSNFNSGSVSGNISFGSFISAVFNLIMNGGTLTNTNTGVISSLGIGSLIEAEAAFTINGGKLINNDTVWTPLLKIGPAGAVSGSGLFQNVGRAPTIQMTNSGTVIPGGPDLGGSPGVMTVQGSYNQTSTGTLGINILNSSSFSQLNVIGTVQLAGNLQTALSPGGVIIPGETFSIVQGSASVTGTFNNLLNVNIPNLTPHVQYFPNQVLLSFTPSASKYPDYFEALFVSNNHVYRRIQRQTAQIRDRFHEQPEALQQQNIASLMAENSSQEVASPWKQSGGQRELGLVRYQQTERKQEQLQREMVVCEEYPWNFYFGPTGGLGDVLTKKDAAGFSYWSAGALAGFDYAFSEVGVGLLVNYDHIRGDVAHHWGKFNLDHVHANFYATYAPRSMPQLAVNAILGGGYDWIHIRRNAGLKAAPAVGKGSPGGGEFDAFLGVEYAFDRSQYCAMPPCLQVVPLISLQYTSLHAGKYPEHGAGPFGLCFGSQSAESLRSTLGARLNYTKKWQDVVFIPELNLGWQREFLDQSRSVHFKPVDFAVSKADLRMPRSGRNTALAGVDFLFILFEKYGIEASYDFEWNSLYHDHFFYVGCNFRF